MIVLLSPAKTLDVSPVDDSLPTSTPRGADDAALLAEMLRELSKADLKALLGVSDSLATLNHDRLQNWSRQQRKQCFLSYDGPAFKNIDPSSFSAEQLDFAQRHVRVLSGMYGLLRPLDLIEPYRLEMGSKFKDWSGRNLYAYWREKIQAWLQSDLEEMPVKQRCLVNCASQEYTKAVDFKNFKIPVYNMTFAGASMFAKAARGAMVRHIVTKQVTNPEDLKSFAGVDGEWRFSEERSSELDFVFLRDTGRAKSRRKDSAGSDAVQKKRQRR